MSITHNRFFNDTVQSLRFNHGEAGATVGVMLPGTHVFNLKAPETMSVVAGEMFVSINDAPEFTAPAGAVFEAPANSKLQMRCTVDTAYLCQFHLS